MVSYQSTLSPVKSSFVRKRDNSKWGRRRRNLFKRLISGVKKAHFLHKQVWFVTLTTSKELVEIVGSGQRSIRDVFKRNFSVFVKRARRIFGSFEYCAVHTDEGNGVYHLLVNSVSIGTRFTFGGYCGFKAFHYWVSEAWFDIHLSPNVWVTRCYGKFRKIVNYVCRYMHSQHKMLRYHWSKNWVFSGYVKAWKYHLSGWKWIVTGKQSF